MYDFNREWESFKSEVLEEHKNNPELMSTFKRTFAAASLTTAVKFLRDMGRDSFDLTPYIRQPAAVLGMVGDDLDRLDNLVKALLEEAANRSTNVKAGFGNGEVIGQC